MLSQAFVRQIYDIDPSLKDKVKYQQFDFHHYTSGNQFDSLKVLIAKVEKDVIEHSYFIENIQKKEVERLQNGVFRTNCLDSLDRTNVAQSKIGMFAL